MNREHHLWHSQRLGRDMDLVLFGHGGDPVILFPTSCGRFYQNEDFGLIAAISGKIESGRAVVLCVDSVDEESWYNKAAPPCERVARHERYESYILDEVVPLARSRGAGRLTLMGCSFGGFHTVSIGLRHPQVFERLISIAGKYETESFLDGYHDEGVYFHSVFHWLSNLTDEALLSALGRLDITLAVGEHDFCRPSNERLSALLWEKGIGNHLSVWNGATHDWPVWREMAALYL